MHDDGTQVKQGDRLAEWDPFTMPVIKEKPGVVKYQDLIDGKTLVEQTDEATGIDQGVVRESRGAARSAQKSAVRGQCVLLRVDIGCSRRLKEKKSTIYSK